MMPPILPKTKYTFEYKFQSQKYAIKLKVALENASYRQSNQRNYCNYTAEPKISHLSLIQRSVVYSFVFISQFIEQYVALIDVHVQVDMNTVANQRKPPAHR